MAGEAQENRTTDLILTTEIWDATSTTLLHSARGWKPRGVLSAFQEICERFLQSQPLKVTITRPTNLPVEVIRDWYQTDDLPKISDASLQAACASFLTRIL